MGSTRYQCKVLQKFPFWRIKDTDVKVGMTFEVVQLDHTEWPEVGGAYYCVPPASDPDFSGARLAFLEKHKYIQFIRSSG